jgi:hypothetical protein
MTFARVELERLKMQVNQHRQSAGRAHCANLLSA